MAKTERSFRRYPAQRARRQIDTVEIESESGLRTHDHSLLLRIRPFGRCALSKPRAGARRLRAGQVGKDDAMKKDSMSHESMKKDSISKDTMSKDSMSKESMSKDSMKKDDGMKKH